MGCNISQSNNKIAPQTQVKLSRQQIINLIQQKHYEQAQKIADILFKEKNYCSAILIYQQIIQHNLQQDYQPLGLGNSELLSGLAQKIHQYYDNILKQKSRNRNPFDSLSLCYLAIKREDQEIEKGIVWYQKQLQKVQNYQIIMGYANLLSNAYEFDLAVPMYKRAISLKPNLINAYVSLAFIYQFFRKDKLSLQKTLAKIMQIDPSNIYAQFIIASNSLMIQRIQKLKELSKSFPLYVRVLNEIGLTYCLRKEYLIAKNQFNKCINILSGYAVPYYNMAAVLQLQHQYKQSCHWHLRACEQNNNFHESYYSLVGLFIDLRHKEDDIIKMLEMYPKIDKFQYFYNLGLAYYELKYYNIAKKWYLEALQIKEDCKVYNSLGLVYDNLEKIYQTANSYQKCLKINPKYYLAYYNLAIFYKKHLKTQMALDHLKKALNINPRFWEAYTNQGNIYSSKSQYDVAVNCYKSAVFYNSSYVLAHTNRMVCQELRGSNLKALQAFNKAKEHFPYQAHRLAQKSKTYIKNHLENCNKKWRGFSLQHSSSEPLFEIRPEILINEDDQVGLNYRKHPQHSLLHKKFIPYKFLQ